MLVLLLRYALLLMPNSQECAVEFVQKLGGEVKYEAKADGVQMITVDLSTTQVTDADLKELTALGNITNLNLNGTKVTDAGLKELVGFTNLTSLDLRRTQVTSDGLKQLSRLKNVNDPVSY